MRILYHVVILDFVYCANLAFSAGTSGHSLYMQPRLPVLAGGAEAETMNSVCSALVVVSGSAQIVAIEGPYAQFGIPQDAVGKQWRDVFTSWGLPGLPTAAADYPFLARVTAPTNEDVTVELFRVRQPDGTHRIYAIFRGKFGVRLTTKQEQLCGLGELSADVAHEMNNALTLLMGWIELLKAERQDDHRLRQTLDLLMCEADRMSRLTRNLLEVARDTGELVHPLDMRTLLSEVLSLVEYEMKSSNIEIDSELAPQLPCVNGSSGRLKQALLNLLINARQAMPSGGRVTVSAEPDPEGNLRVAVEDTGAGIPDGIRENIFNPYFTTKPNGTGLGLHVTQRIVEDHGGRLELESRPGKGARFTLMLPAESS